MKLYGTWSASELTPEARKAAQETVNAYSDTLNRMTAVASPGSVVETVGIPRVMAEIQRRKEFIRCCDECAADTKRGAAQ